MGLSRADLADLLGAKVVSIGKYEKAGEEGGQYPPFPKLANLAFILNMEPNTLFWAGLDKDTYEAFADKGGQMSSYYLMHSLAKKKGKDADEVKALIDDREFGHQSDIRFSNLKEKFGFLDLFREVVREEIRNELKSSKENGPSQKDLSRSMNSKNNTEAVDAASTRNPGGTDEAV